MLLRQEGKSENFVLQCTPKQNGVFGLYFQIDLYRMDFKYTLVTHVYSGLEIPKKLSIIALKYSWSTLKYGEVQNFRFFSLVLRSFLIIMNVI